VANSDIVHVIDDDAEVRHSLAFLLSTVGLPVRLHDSATSFLAALPEAQDGCIVTDVRMPGMDGIELQRHLRTQGNAIPVIVITGHGDIALAVEAMKAGAVDFIEKPFDDEMLIASIRTALARGADVRERDTEVAQVRTRLKLLSERERQVLERLVAGKPNKIIAHELDISARTVEIYRANVMTKMQADSLSALVRMALLGGDLP
jgi:two-component system, LuxR family, response regulator FixJ